MKKKIVIAILILLILLIFIAILLGLQTFILSREKETILEGEVYLTDDDALALGNGFWKKAHEAYWKKSFVYEKEGNRFRDYEIEGMNYFKILNYYTVADIFTTEGLEKFEEELGIIHIGDSVYIVQADRGSDIRYIESTLEIHSRHNDRLVFSVVSSYADSVENLESSNIEIERTSFVLKNIEGRWKVDQFEMVD